MDRIILIKESSDMVILQVRAGSENEAFDCVNEWIDTNEYPCGIAERLIGYSTETPEKHSGGSRSDVLGLYYYYQISPNRAGALARTIKLDQV